MSRGVYWMRVSQIAGLLLTCLSSAMTPMTSADDRLRRIDFSRDIRPILSDTCFTCHGPDEQRRRSELRLDTREGIFSQRDGQPVILPGSVESSLLLRRITETDPDAKMPPKDSGRTLTGEQVQLLTEWVRQGAAWTDQWSFISPQAHAPPQTPSSHGSRNGIDDFVFANLERIGLRPADPVARRTLIRRVSLDLTGLPPTPDEVSDFLADASPEAYEKVVDRLLASPRYGENMAVGWLDAARYADTSGYQNDGPRHMWRWRDWVIDAFNSNKPFDQFTVEQLAGDLLENPTLDQLIATGFNRNHRGNSEGGIIPEEYQVEYVVDRVDTSCTVWLGLTMGCARCHDHKYDPLRQKEFYQLFAYFNNIPENGRAIKEGNSPPMVKAPLSAEQSQLLHLDQQIQAATARVKELQSKLAQTQREWESRYSPTSTPEPFGHQTVDLSVTEGLANHFGFEGNLKDSVQSADALFETHSAKPASFVAGQMGEAIRLDGSSFVSAGDCAIFGYFDKFSMAFWMWASQADGTLVSRMNPVEEGAGYCVHLDQGRVQVNLVKRWLDDAIRLESQERLPLDQWHHLTVTYDGSRLASGIHVYVNGEPFSMNVKLDQINQSFAVTNQPFRIGSGHSHFVGAMDDVRVYRHDLSSSEAQLLAVRENISEILRMPTTSRTDAQRQKLTRYFLENQASPDIWEAHRRLINLQQQRQTFYENLPTVMVMQELKQRRETRILLRGQYDLPGVHVEPGVPAVFPALPANVPNNRLGFAMWLVGPDHPLTARVAVNRIWQQFFGQGLVRTTEDFGAQGDTPMHPELLDWLAMELVRSGWDVKAIQKRIVTSAIYRQSSAVSKELLQRDPDNRLLARGPRQRLTAETIRDQALFVSGLLQERIGGPSVKPYQPEGLWQEIATDTEYKQSHGEDLYRRSLYTYWKRTVAPPTMVTLDATSREACTVQRTRTNTPLQALALLNDVTFVEAARALAQRVMNEAEGEENRITRAFLLATARLPRPEELALLLRRQGLSRQAFHSDQAAARELNQVGEFPVDDRWDACDLAAFTTVMSLILNLDEIVNKE